MKKLILQLIAICATGILIPALAQSDANQMPAEEGAPGSPPPPEMAPNLQPTAPGNNQQNAPAAPLGHITFVKATAPGQPASAQTQSSSGTMVHTPTPMAPPAGNGNANADELRLNFDNVPLNIVLNYLSDAAGFIIILDTQVHGNVSVISSHPMTRDEAVDLLNSVLNQNGYAAIRDGRTLTIVDKNDAKTRDIPVQIGNDPENIPKNDVIVTQIIPVRYVDATQLVTDLSSFVSPQATIVANQAGNSIVVTDTQENIRHLVEIIAAIDQSAAGETEIQVFPMRYANPNDVATELGQIFPSGNGGSSGSQMPIRFGGPGGFFSRMMAASAAASGGDNNRAQKQSQVTAVADGRTQSIIVMASKDLMPEIAGMMSELDVPSARDQKVFTYHLKNADPEEVAQILQSTFQSTTSSRGGGSSSSQQQQETSALVQRETQGATTTSQNSSSLSTVNGSTGRGAGGGGATP